jgi:photosystem II stability/assembly factor-like uncharacterized protein
MRLITTVLLFSGWTLQPVQTASSLRGLSALDERVAFASGSGGAVLHTVDGGAHWTQASIPGAGELDFRDVEAVDDKTVYLMSAGPGRLSRVYKSGDGGVNWTIVLNNPDAQGFFDAIGFWDRERGLIAGDPVDGKFVLIRTLDGGDSWQRITPPANAGEGAFAASGTCLIVRPGGRAWVGTGGPGGARVLRSTDYGVTWRTSQAPIRHDDAAAGIFSLAFGDDLHGIAVGGIYTKPGEDRDNVAVSSDGGKTWSAPKGARPGGFRSAVVFLANGDALATGPGGTDISHDGGLSWSAFSTDGFHSLSAAGWASGAKGRIASLRPTPKPGTETGARP